MPLIFFLLGSMSLHAQSAWDTSGIHEITKPISLLNPPDRHEILHHLQIVASQLRAEAVTINGQQTFFVQATGSSYYCAPVGNCSFWIFDANHKIVLKADAQMVGYLPTLHNGRNDVLIARHNSAVEKDLARWEFDGIRYRRVRCADATYADFDGKVYNPPHIKAIPCTFM